MGAIFFFFFLAVIFCIAMFFIILSVSLLILRSKKEKQGKAVKRSSYIILVAILIISSLAALLPVGYIAFLRIVNMSDQPEIIYAESGKMLSWPMGDYESDTNWFDMNGTKYVRFREGFSDDPFYLCETEDKRGEPVANIKFNQEDDSLFNEAMTLLLAGHMRDTLDMSTVYPLRNKNDFKFIEVSGTAGSGVFCPEQDLDSLRAYYADSSNYDTQNITCEYSVYSDKKGSGERRDTPYINVSKNVTLVPEIFIKLDTALDSGQGIKRIAIPQKYIELDEAAQPGAPIFGYDERELLAYSGDKMAFRHAYLVLLEGQVYVEEESGYQYIKGYPLSNEMNEYIIKAVFDN